jgi:hypothetical protein
MSAAVAAKPAWRGLPHDKRDARAEQYRQRLLSAGAAIEQLPSGAVRVARGSDFMTCQNLADLTHADMDRLCRT